MLETIFASKNCERVLQFILVCEYRKDLEPVFHTTMTYNVETKKVIDC